MFAHRYTDENTYEVVEYFDGGSRVLPPDQHDYLAWLAAGNTPMIEAAGRFLSVVNEALVVNPSKATILAMEAPVLLRQAVVAAVQELLDAKAHERSYDNIFTLVSYAESTDPVFHAEGQAGLIWRDQVWASCRQLMEDVVAGRRTIPTVDQVLAELPAFTWPE
jgi:hypothetical protein